MSDLTKFGFTPTGHHPSTPTGTFHPEEAYKNTGSLIELMGEVRSLRIEVNKLKDSDEVKTREIEILKGNLETILEENEELKKSMQKILNEKKDLEKKLAEMDKVLKKTKTDLSMYKKQCEDFARKNKHLEKRLEEIGVGKINWWKVIALCLIGGILCATGGGSIAMLIIGEVALTAGVGAGIGIGGAVGAIAGGGIGYSSQ